MCTIYIYIYETHTHIYIHIHETLMNFLFRFESHKQEISFCISKDSKIERVLKAKMLCPKHFRYGLFNLCIKKISFKYIYMV
jgi:hypothetical protein